MLTGHINPCSNLQGKKKMHQSFKYAVIFVFLPRISSVFPFFSVMLAATNSFSSKSVPEFSRLFSFNNTTNWNSWRTILTSQIFSCKFHGSLFFPAHQQLFQSKQTSWFQHQQGKHNHFSTTICPIFLY